jgi:hypothetical protein
MLRIGLYCECGESDFKVSQDILTGAISMSCNGCGRMHLIAVINREQVDCVNQKRDFYNPSLRID